MGLGIDTTRLLRKGRRGKLLCNGLYMRAKPGTVTAIMGPSGCGKSVLLRILTGYDRPCEGQVRVGTSDLHREYRDVRRQIGYVPQAEIMLPELRVKTSLDYRIRFSQSGTTRRYRQERIQRLIDLLGLREPVEENDLLEKRIGSPESRGDYPSGGQRRKINIAHELLGRPQVLLMDEPTSGLAAPDADDLVEKFRLIAREEAIPIVLTIHAPSQQAFEMFDDLLVMGRGGIPVYYGKRYMAVSYVRRTLGLGSVEKQNDADYVLEPVRHVDDADRAYRTLEQCRGKQEYAYLRVPLDEDGHGQA